MRLNARLRLVRPTSIAAVGLAASFLCGSLALACDGSSAETSERYALSSGKPPATQPGVATPVRAPAARR